MRSEVFIISAFHVENHEAEIHMYELVSASA